jgi:hypothetical protein
VQPLAANARIQEDKMDIKLLSQSAAEGKG